MGFVPTQCELSQDRSPFKKKKQQDGKQDIICQTSLQLVNTLAKFYTCDKQKYFHIGILGPLTSTV